jgi:hypothetical protein
VSYSDKLECRITIRHLPDGTSSVGMYDPISGRHEPLGTHGGRNDTAKRELDRVVCDLKVSIERAGHCVTFSERKL